MDQFYFEEGYIESAYFGYVANAEAALSSSATLTASVKIANASGYFIEEYIAEDYFVSGNIKEAAAALSASASQSSDISVIRSASVSMSIVSTITATGIHLEGAELFAFTEAQLSVQANRIRDVNVEVSGVFTVAAEVVRIKSLSSDETAIFDAIINGLRSRAFQIETQAAFSLTATGIHLEGAELVAFTNAALTATAIKTAAAAITLNSSAALAIGQRPIEFKAGSVDAGRRQITTAVKKFGAGSLAISSNTTNLPNNLGYVEYFVPGTWLPTQFDENTRYLNFDFWIYKGNVTGTRPIISIYDNNGWIFSINSRIDSGNVGYISITYSNQTVLSDSVTSYVDGWAHVALTIGCRSSAVNSTAIWINGSRKKLTTALPLFNNNQSLALTMLVGARPDAPFNDSFNIDELRVTAGAATYNINSSTITVPTDRYWSSDNAYTAALLHYDSDYADDLGEKFDLAANLSASFTQTTLGIEPILFTASLNAAFTQSAQVEKLKLANSSMTAAFTQSAEAVKTAESAVTMSVSGEQTTAVIRLRPFSSDQQSAFTQTTESVKIVEVQSTQTAAFTQTTEAEANKPFSADLDLFAATLTAAAKVAVFFVNVDVVASQTASAVKNAAAQSTQAAAFTQTAAAVKAVEAASSITATFTQSTDVIRSRPFDSQLSTSTALSCDVIVVTVTDVNLSSATTVSVTADKITGYTADLPVSINQTAVAERIRSVDTAQSASFNQTVSATVEYSAAAALTASVALSVTAIHLEGAELTAFTNATLTCDPTLGVTFESSMSAAFTQSAAASRVARTDITFAQVTASIIAANQRIRNLSSVQTAQTVQISAGVVTRSASSNLAATFTIDAPVGEVMFAELVAFTNAALTVTAIKAVIASGAISSISALAVDGIRIKPLASTVTATLTLNAANQRIRGYNASVTTAASLVATPTLLFQLSATINSAMSFTAVVREIDIDVVNQYVYVIPNDIRLYSIPEEIWSRAVPEETRIYNVRRT